MAAVITNPTWGMTDRESAVRLRNVVPEATFYHKNEYRLASPFGPAVLRIGMTSSIKWAYRVLGFDPPKPDKIGGNARPEVGQLTP